MKGLLHSKLFRKNLCKWIFMYIVAIGLFTSVVTYSKYISSMQSEGDKVKVAKFDAEIIYDECPTLQDNNVCEIGTFRPTSNLSYYFTVDTTNIEVSAVFATVVEVSEEFKNIKIYDITDTETEITNYTQTDNKITFVRDIEPGLNYIKKYKVTMDYNYEIYDPEYRSEHKVTGVLKVGYSAVQKD